MTTKAQRNQALSEAAASLRLEGVAFSPANADLRKAWADGSMNADQVRKAMIERAVGASAKKAAA